MDNVSSEAVVTVKTIVAETTKSIIERNGLSPSRFARDLKTSRQRVFQWTNESTVPNLDVVARALKLGSTEPGKEHLLEWGRALLSRLGEVK